MIFFVFAFMQWITYDYPDVLPFYYPGAGFFPGMFGQVLNWLLVVVIAGIGLCLWNLDRLLKRR